MERSTRHQKKKKRMNKERQTTGAQSREGKNLLNLASDAMLFDDVLESFILVEMTSHDLERDFDSQCLLKSSLLH